MWWVSGVSGQLTESTSARRNSSSIPTSSTPSSAATAWSANGSWAMKRHVERPGEAEHLGADVADAERAEGAADEADPHVLRAPGVAGGGLAGQPVLDHQLAGQRQHQRQHRGRDRPPDPVRGDDEGDPGPGAGLDVDGVVADAEAGHHREAAALRHALGREAVGEQDQRVEVLELLGAERARGLEERHLDAGRAAQRLEVEVGIGRRAVRLAEVARERHAKLGHRRPPTGTRRAIRRSPRRARCAAPRRHPNSR